MHAASSPQRALEKAWEEQASATRKAVAGGLALAKENEELKKQRDQRAAQAATETQKAK